ncbi:MAG: protein kinase [Verrucomicrobia bacterium]|nr:protein kinase [Verrucomicrobiota bacterium]
MKIATRSIRREEDSTVYRPTDAASLASQYEIIDKIGDGGMGVVYLARDRRLGRCVAIKRLNASSLSSEGMKDRFFQEARAVASLNHIHIVHVYSLGEDREGPFIVMEYVAGPKPPAREGSPPPAYALADRVHREGPMPLDSALDMLIKLCRAVEYAHSCSVIHRDLKPTNVLLDESGEPKVVDFGLARVQREEVKPLTLPGETMLSLGYGAPEQETDASLADERADVYGLGALLYFCITGKNPRYFRQNDLPEVLRMPIVKALETDRESRWSTVKALRTALTLIQSPSQTKLSTAKTTWHCKWCTTTNPVAIRYCGQCGWDGGVLCAECGSESRFGIQYCGVCGADAKAYENAQRVLAAMLQHVERREFALVAQEENQLSGFRPQGVNGRKLVDRAHQVSDQAATAFRRRAALHNEIRREMDEGNYEQVRKYIDEYNALAFDGAFSETESQLDTLQFDRDLARLRVAVRAKHWKYALRLARELRAKDATEDVEQLHTRIMRQFRWKRSVKVAGLVAAGFLCYLLSGAPVYRATGRPEGGLFGVLYAPLEWVQGATLFRRPLEAYARAYDAADMFGK